MNKIKKALYTATATALAVAPLMASALTAPDKKGFAVSQSEQGSNLAKDTIWTLVTNLMNWLLGIIGALAVVAFVIAGILYLTAAGDEEQVEKAKTTMTYAIVGLVVALLGLVIVNAVAGLTGTTGTTAY